MLSVAYLDMLVAWHQAPKTKGAKKVDKLQQWMVIRVDGDPPPAYERWTNEDKQRLVALHATKIDISDMQCRRGVALKKRELVLSGRASFRYSTLASEEKASEK